MVQYMYVPHTGWYTVLLQKNLKSCLPCSQSCLYLLILFSDCISLSLRLPCNSSFIKIPKSATKSSPLTKIKLTCCNFFKVRTCPTYINTFHYILRIDYGLQWMSRKLLQILLLMALQSCSSLHLHEENQSRFHQLQTFETQIFKIY